MDEEQEERKTTHLISKTSFVIMLVIAILCDGISFLLGFIVVDGGVLNDIFSFVVNLGIWFWTARRGMGLKGAMSGGAGMVIEIIPVINLLPTFTALVIGLYIASRVKEKIPLPAAAELAKKI